MITNLFGNVDVGREIRVVPVGRERIGIARFAYQIGELRISGFGVGERMHLIVQVEIGYRADGCVGVSVINASPRLSVAAFTDVESVFLAFVFGNVLRTFHE